MYFYNIAQNVEESEVKFLVEIAAAKRGVNFDLREAGKSFKVWDYQANSIYAWIFAGLITINNSDFRRIVTKRTVQNVLDFVFSPEFLLATRAKSGVESGTNSETDSEVNSETDSSSNKNFYIFRSDASFLPEERIEARATLARDISVLIERRQQGENIYDLYAETTPIKACFYYWIKEVLRPPGQSDSFSAARENDIIRKTEKLCEMYKTGLQTDNNKFESIHPSWSMDQIDTNMIGVVLTQVRSYISRKSKVMEMVKETSSNTIRLGEKVIDVDKEAKVVINSVKQKELPTDIFEDMQQIYDHSKEFFSVHNTNTTSTTLIEFGLEDELKQNMDKLQQLLIVEYGGADTGLYAPQVYQNNILGTERSFKMDSGIDAKRADAKRYMDLLTNVPPEDLLESFSKVTPDIYFKSIAKYGVTMGIYDSSGHKSKSVALFDFLSRQYNEFDPHQSLDKSVSEPITLIVPLKKDAKDYCLKVKGTNAYAHLRESLKQRPELSIADCTLTSEHDLERFKKSASIRSFLQHKNEVADNSVLFDDGEFAELYKSTASVDSSLFLKAGFKNNMLYGSNPLYTVNEELGTGNIDTKRQSSRTVKVVADQIHKIFEEFHQTHGVCLEHASGENSGKTTSKDAMLRYNIVLPGISLIDFVERIYNPSMILAYLQNMVRMPWIPADRQGNPDICGYSYILSNLAPDTPILRSQKSHSLASFEYLSFDNDLGLFKILDNMIYDVVIPDVFNRVYPRDAMDNLVELESNQVILDCYGLVRSYIGGALILLDLCKGNFFGIKAVPKNAEFNGWCESFNRVLCLFIRQLYQVKSVTEFEDISSQFYSYFQGNVRYINDLVARANQKSGKRKPMDGYQNVLDYEKSVSAYVKELFMDFTRTREPFNAKIQRDNRLDNSSNVVNKNELDINNARSEVELYRERRAQININKFVYTCYLRVISRIFWTIRHIGNDSVELANNTENKASENSTSGADSVFSNIVTHDLYIAHRSKAMSKCIHDYKALEYVNQQTLSTYSAMQTPLTELEVNNLSELAELTEAETAHMLQGCDVYLSKFLNGTISSLNKQISEDNKTALDAYYSHVFEYNISRLTNNFYIKNAKTSDLDMAKVMRLAKDFNSQVIKANVPKLYREQFKKLAIYRDKIFNEQGLATVNNHIYVYTNETYLPNKDGVSELKKTYYLIHKDGYILQYTPTGLIVAVPKSVQLITCSSYEHCKFKSDDGRKFLSSGKDNPEAFVLEDVNYTRVQNAINKNLKELMNLKVEFEPCPTFVIKQSPKVDLSRFVDESVEGHYTAYTYEELRLNNGQSIGWPSKIKITNFNLYVPIRQQKWKV